VKLFLHVFPTISPVHVAAVCTIVMSYIFLSDLKDHVYLSIKVFFHSILSIFFRDVEVIGRENIPSYGPVLFTVNHANQFIDAVMVLCTCQRKISYLMAEASWKRRIVGDIAWALGVVPVKRAQDEATTGSGRIEYDRPATMMSASPSATPSKKIAGSDGGDGGTDGGGSSNNNVDDVETIEFEVHGIDTKFTSELHVGDKIRPSGTAFALKVKQIVSADRLVVDGAGMPSDFPFPSSKEKGAIPYDILKHTPLDVVFSKVLDRLAAGGAVGIFPEGGSHDRTDLLPLKVGVSLIAYSALDKVGINVPIVPVGLNYFRAHRWRGRAVVEFGRPIHIKSGTLDKFRAGGSQVRFNCSTCHVSNP
jgi:glycerol-3-phosphate O-acyltransferase / dihydroxyacetone phosphate acyltransferase